MCQQILVQPCNIKFMKNNSVACQLHTDIAKLKGTFFKLLVVQLFLSIYRYYSVSLILHFTIHSDMIYDMIKHINNCI
jgi:hypothetical protein